MFNLADYPVTSMVVMVAGLLDAVLKTNDRLDCSYITHFHSRSVPNIGIDAYLLRILRFTPFTNEALLSLLVYFDRIAERTHHAFVINSLNVHRLLITSIVIASKLTSDVFYPNTRYAKVGGLPLVELNQLEIEFLFLCNFDLHVAVEDLQAYGEQLLVHAKQSQPLYYLPIKSSPSLQRLKQSYTMDGKATQALRPIKRRRPVCDRSQEPLSTRLRPLCVTSLRECGHLPLTSHIPTPINMLSPHEP